MGGSLCIMAVDGMDLDGTMYKGIQPGGTSCIMQ